MCSSDLAAAQSDENEEVMRALLIHEKRSGAGPAGGGAKAAAKALASAGNASDSDSDTSESDEDSPMAPPPAAAAGSSQQRRAEVEDDDEEEFEEVGEDHMVMVAGKAYSYREVSQRPELVEQMSTQEKEAYIEIGQNLFQDMYF